MIRATVGARRVEASPFAPRKNAIFAERKATISGVSPSNLQDNDVPRQAKFEYYDAQARWRTVGPLGRSPRTTQVKDPSGLVPLVNKVGWLRQESAKTTDPHVLVTWVKEIGGHAQPGEPHSPSGRAGRGLDAHSVSVVAFQPRSPAGQAGRGLTRLV